MKYLVKKIVLLLKEYLCSGDIEEATLCLKELEVPHFHHELVYEVRRRSIDVKIHHLARNFFLRRLHLKSSRLSCQKLLYTKGRFIIVHLYVQWFVWGCGPATSH